MSFVQRLIDSRLSYLRITPDDDDNFEIEDFDLDWKELLSCKFLQMQDVTIYSLKGIDKLTQLHTLEMIRIDYNDDDFSPLSNLKNLKRFHLNLDRIIDDDDADFPDSVSLNNIESLESLIVDCDIQELYMDNLPKLKDLTIGGFVGFFSISESVRNNIEKLSINNFYYGEEGDLCFPFFPNIKSLSLHFGDELEDSESYLLQYNLYKLEDMHICGFTDADIEEFKLDNLKRRINNSAEIINKYLLRRKINNIWTSFLTAIDKDNLNRLSYLVF